MEKDLLYRFFEGNCSEKEIREVREWVEASSENRNVFLHEGKMFDAIDLMASGKYIQDHNLKFRIKPFVWESLKIAATIIVVLSLAGGWQYYVRKNSKLAMNIIHTPAGKSANVTLPDGTKAWLNARTTIQYPSSFEQHKREIILDGEAYFEVTHDKKKPFIVHTGEYDIEVVGTKFNIEAYSFENETVTSLMEGSVKLASEKDPDQSILLKPNQMAYLKNGGFVVQEISDYNRYRWKDGLICFDNVSFPETMKEFEKYYEAHIIIENKKVVDYLCTGKFRQSDGIDHALRVLQKDISFKFERVENTNIIYIK